MRYEEEFTKNAIEKYLRSIGIVPTILPGSEPPDYFVTIEAKTYPLEVTNAETLAYTDEGKTGRLRHYLVPFEDFYKKINTSPLVDKIDVPKDKTVLIYINLPILEWRDFKKVFIGLLNKGYLALVSEVTKRFPDNIKHAMIVAKPNDGVPIKFAIGAKNPEIDIALQIRTLLLERFEIKEKKLNSSSITGDKWLGILNNYFFDDKDIWLHELNNLNIQHSFKRVFIIMINGDVLDVKFD